MFALQNVGLARSGLVFQFNISKELEKYDKTLRTVHLVTRSDYGLLAWGNTGPLIFPLSKVPLKHPRNVFQSSARWMAPTYCLH